MAPGIARCPQPNKLVKLTNKLNNHLLNIFPGQIKACPWEMSTPKLITFFTCRLGAAAILSDPLRSSRFKHAFGVLLAAWLYC